VVHFALQELRNEITDSQREQAISRLRQHLGEISGRRASRN
jgi:hypothetical protein